MFYYAQLDENDICIGISELSGQAWSSNMVPLCAFDAGLLGRAYDRITGHWGDVPAEEAAPTQADRIEANTDYLVMIMS